MSRLKACTALLLAGLVLLLGSPADGAADPIATLQEEKAALAARERAALLELYSLETHLGAAESRLGRLEARVAPLARLQAAVQLRLAAARRTLAASQQLLGLQLRLLYEHERPDALGILVGAGSFDEVLTGIDELERTALATNELAERARVARRSIAVLTRQLAGRAAELARFRAQARAEASELRQEREDKASYLASLREEQRLRAEEIAALERRARAAEARTRAAEARSAASSSVATFTAQTATAPPPVRASTPRPARFSRTLTVLSTGYALPGTTATGLPVGPGIVAVDPAVIPLGTRMTVPGYGEGVAADTGSGISGARIDLWFPTRRQALVWGWRTVTITLHR